MTKKYTIMQTLEGKDVISYTENGLTYSFMADPANSDYQAYLNPDANQNNPVGGN